MDLVRIRYMKEWISQLPSGNITYKTINGKKYPYYQWTENGKQRSRVVKKDEFDELSEKITQRKTLEIYREIASTIPSKLAFRI